MRSGPLVACFAALVAGCAAEVAALPDLRGEVTALTLSTACVSRSAPFQIVVDVRNPHQEAGRVRFAVHVRQFGNVAAPTTELAAGETRTLHLPAAIDFAGVWEVYASGATSLAQQRDIRVIDPATPARC